MLKFLRKYGKWILVVCGSLLMIAWLVPSGLQEMQKGQINPVVMTVDGESIHQKDLLQSAVELEVLKRCGIQPAATVEHWYLLSKFAQDSGYVGGRSDAAPLLERIAQILATQSMVEQNPQYRQMIQYIQYLPGWDEQLAMARDQMPQFLSRLAMQVGANEEIVTGAFVHVAGVQRMQEAYLTAPRYSGRRLVSDARNLMDSAKIDYLFIPADAYAAEVADPSEEELTAFYERFKGTLSADAIVEDPKAEKPGGEYGIGYLLPPRVKVTYLTLNRQAISQAVQPSELDVQKRFLAQFPSGTVPESLGQTAEQIKAGLREAVRAELVEKAMKTAQDAVRAEFAKSTGKLASEGDYKKLPEDWAERRPSFAAAAKAVSQRLREVDNIVVTTPQVTTLDTWQTTRQLAGQPGIGQAYYEQAGRRLPFALQVMKVREIAGANEAHVQVDVPSVDVLMDQQGNRYFFMITGAKKQSNPDSLDEARELVTADYKRMKAYEALSGRVDEFRQKAAGEGLAQVLAQQQERLEETNPVRTTLRVTETTLGRLGQQAAVSGQGGDQRIDNKDFYDQVMDKAEVLDPAKPGEETAAEQRAVAQALPRSLGVVVAVVKAFVPVTREDYRSGQLQLTQNLSTRAAEELMPDMTADNPFTLENLQKRMNVEFSRPVRDEGEEEETQS